MIHTNWVGSVTERDMDMLLLEEIFVSDLFRSWLADRLFPAASKHIEFVGAWHSVHDAKLGETDLLVVFSNAVNKQYACFLEDKIDASFTDRQAERYRLRKDRSIVSGRCDLAMTCLAAPQRYIDSHAIDVAIFDTALSYEAIRDRIAQGNDARSRYKARFIQEAIDQNRRGYVATVDHDVTEFWKSYWEISTQRTPQLKMKNPSKGRPTASRFFYFTDCLPKGVKIVHKAIFDAVDLQFSNTDVGSLTRRISDKLDDRMKIVKAAKSAAIRIEVRQVVLTHPTGAQIEAIEQSLDAAAELLKFFETNRRSLGF